MKASMRIVPKSGLIRDPVTGMRLKDGISISVPKTSYWLRRLKQGDVMLQMKMAPDKKKSPPKKEKEKKSEESK